MVSFAFLSGAIAAGLGVVAIWFAWRKTKGQPLLRIVAMVVAVIFVLVLNVAVKEINSGMAGQALRSAAVMKDLVKNPKVDKEGELAKALDVMIAGFRNRIGVADENGALIWDASRDGNVLNITVQMPVEQRITPRLPDVESKWLTVKKHLCSQETIETIKRGVSWNYTYVTRRNDKIYSLLVDRCDDDVPGSRARLYIAANELTTRLVKALNSPTSPRCDGMWDDGRLCYSLHPPYYVFAPRWGQR